MTVGGASAKKFLVVRLGSLGDILHTLPAATSLRHSIPGAQVDWVVERKWAALLEGHADLNEVILLDRSSWSALGSCVRRLRENKYICAIDFQGLYKSAILARLSGAPRRIGFNWRFAREGGATVLYTERVTPPAGHIVEQNRALAQAAGAGPQFYRLALPLPEEGPVALARRLGLGGMPEFIVVSPGGGWRSKCWPPKRYGELCRELGRRHGWRAVVNFGPGERDLAEAVCRAAAPALPVMFSGDLRQLMALLMGAKVVVAGDTGPLHLAVALGTPVVGLYGPTDPARNGPYSDADIVVSNSRPEEITYTRGDDYSAPMLSISVEQVFSAVERRLGIA